MALLGHSVLTDIRDVNGNDYTGQNNGTPVAVALVVGEDTVGATVNLRVFLDGANTVYVQNVPAANVEDVTPSASTTTSTSSSSSSK